MEEVSSRGPSHHGTCFIEPIPNRIYVCDREEKYEQLRVDVKGSSCPQLPTTYPPLTDDQTDLPGVTVLKNGHLVARCSDFVMYSVEAEFINRVVAEYGPCKSISTKLTLSTKRHVDS